jgi:hypothetical protein
VAGSDPGPFDEAYWRAYRARARRRASAYGALLIAPFGILLGVVKILEPANLPPGDIRNTIEFRLVFYGLMIAVLVAVLVVSIRFLVAERRRRG